MPRGFYPLSRSDPSRPGTFDLVQPVIAISCFKTRDVGYTLGFRDSAGVMDAFDLGALALQQGSEVTFHLADPGVIGR